MKEKRSFIRIALPLAFIGGAALLLSVLLNRSLCPIYNIIGLPCPSCGMTRAYSALLSGHVATAFRMHPLFWVVPLLIGLPLLQKKNLKLGNGVGIALIVLFLALWIVRMVLYFPHTEPMVWNDGALLPSLWRWIAG